MRHQSFNFFELFYFGTSDLIYKRLLGSRLDFSDEPEPDNTHYKNGTTFITCHTGSEWLAVTKIFRESYKHMSNVS